MRDYSDIMEKERPNHVNDDFYIRHPRMTSTDRAKIFAPFAAIKWEEVAKRAEEKNFNLTEDEIEREDILDGFEVML